MSASVSNRSVINVSPLRGLPASLFGISVSAFLAWRWMAREDSVLSADTGLGYALGIFGVSCMLLLLVYPLRKRARFMHNWMSVRHWFRLHMMLGIIGPAAILVHCNFQWGAMNSAIALFCMLLVVGSGIIGRYIYAKIHLGLYGQKATREELLRVVNVQRRELAKLFVNYPDAHQRLEAVHMAFAQNHLSSLDALFAASRARSRKQEFSQYVKAQHSPALNEAWNSCQRTFDECLSTWRRLAQLGLFERMFSWWHILHLPIFIMMIFTAIVHVWAVHSY